MIKIGSFYYGCRLNERYIKDMDLLLQSEADQLLTMPKIHPGGDRTYMLPSDGKTLEIELVSQDGTENFVLDIWRSRARLLKEAYGNRYRKVFVLARLDLNGTHTNPDVEPPLDFLKPYIGMRFQAQTHLHVYVEGFNDRWAVPLPFKTFKEITNTDEVLLNFLNYCNITQPPKFQGTLL